jgi:hypothetical protein
MRMVNLLADSHHILNRWTNYFYQLLNVHNVSDDRQTEIYTAELIVPDSSPSEVEIPSTNLKTYKLTGSDQIPAGCETLWSEIHKPKNYIWNKEESLDQWKGFITVPIHKKGNKIDCSRGQREISC